MRHMVQNQTLIEFQFEIKLDFFLVLSINIYIERERERLIGKAKKKSNLGFKLDSNY